MSFALLVSIDGNDIETHCMVSEACAFGEKQGGRANQFLLLAVVDRLAGARKAIAAAKAYLDKDQVVLVQHDQVDFTKTAAKVFRNGYQSTSRKELRG